MTSEPAVLPGAAEPSRAVTRTPLDLLLFNLRTDADDTALGFTTGWVNEIARRVDHVSVVTMLAGALAVEANVTVRSVGKERGLSEPRRVVEFYRQVREVKRERRIDAAFSHMNPKFALLYAPLAKLHGVPQLLWYAHGTRAPALRAAERLVDRCVTPTESSFPIASPKVVATGHGIDTGRFRPPEAVPPDYERTAISIGRLTATKKIDEMLEALAIVRARGVDVGLELTGEALTAVDAGYERSLRRRAETPDLAGAVAFAGRVPFGDVARRYHRGALFLNLSQTVSMDKAILESMASGCIPLSRNASFARLARDHGLDQLIPAPGPDGLADAMQRALGFPAAERAALAERLRRIVVAEHGLSALADTLVRHLSELAGARGR